MLVEYHKPPPDLIAEEKLLDYSIHRQDVSGWSPATMGLGKERRVATSPADTPSSITSQVASSRNSFVCRLCGIFSINDISILFSNKFSKL